MSGCDERDGSCEAGDIGSELITMSEHFKRLHEDRKSTFIQGQQNIARQTYEIFEYLDTGDQNGLLRALEEFRKIVRPHWGSGVSSNDEQDNSSTGLRREKEG